MSFRESTVSEALGAYLAELERGLKGIPPGRRRTIVHEIEANLLDEAEARGLHDERGMRILLFEKEAPEVLAQEFFRVEGSEASHRGGTALLAGALIGLASGGHLAFDHWRWYIAVSFGVVHGFAVGAGFFWLKRHWQKLGPSLRMVTAVLMCTLLAIPLGFTSRHGFIASRLLYGSFTGYLLERHATGERPQWWLLAESAVFTALMFFVDMVVIHRIHRFRWSMVSSELSFNLTLGLGVLAALWVRKQLSERWLLSAQGQE